MSVMTVTGKVCADSLGLVLPHEHAFIDLRNLVPAPQTISGKVLAQEKVSLTNLGKLHRNPYAVLDNAVLDEEQVMEWELHEFKKAGGKTFVDLTLRDIGRDPVLLARLSRALDIYIIAGCGYYIRPSHPPDMDDKSVDDITEEILREINSGIDGTDIKAGVIGEIGTSEIIYPNERKALIAAAVVQQETGLGVHVHTDLWAQQGSEVIRLLKEHGASVEKICINHIDVDIDLDYIKKLLDQGAYVEFDNFGKEFYADKRHRSVLKGLFARDIERVRAVKELISCGYGSKILLSNDVCLKTCIHHYGGWGYDHIITNIVPMMLDEGITTEQIDALMVKNPAAFLDDGKD
ncbi:phosphotriesterase [Paenibacillus sp. GCM10027626]|uniref:phosphotriesterase family protein n=1 Tax=Paenibacillus sp. GCM10027626 TaxID=3273411 RepID=UPI0036366ABE